LNFGSLNFYLTKFPEKRCTIRFEDRTENLKKVSKHIPKAKTNKVAKRGKIQLIMVLRRLKKPFFSISGKFLLSYKKHN